MVETRLVLASMDDAGARGEIESPVDKFTIPYVWNVKFRHPIDFRSPTHARICFVKGDIYSRLEKKLCGRAGMRDVAARFRANATYIKVKAVGTR